MLYLAVLARVTVPLTTTDVTYLLTRSLTCPYRHTGRHAGGAPIFVAALLAFFACFAAAQVSGEQ